MRIEYGIKTLMMLFISFLMSGCVTEYRVVEHTKYVHIPIGETLTSTIVPLPPPDRGDYITSSFEHRTELLNDYIPDLYSTISKLNNRLTDIHKLDVNNGLLIQKQQEEEDKRVSDIIGKTVTSIKKQE